jgi:hypothetical protein
MIRLDLSYFLRFAAQLTRLRYLRPESKVQDARPTLTEARAWLTHFGQEPMFGSGGMRTAKLQMPPLIESIDAQLGRDDDTQLGFDAYFNVVSALGNFETALLSEATMADAYYVLEKDPYSTLALITKGESLFPPNLPKKVPEALPDMQEAGKCLAFELPTAAAFHIHRATEAVLRRYWTAVTGGSAKPKLRTIGVYLAALKKKGCGDPKVVAALSQMNELHRNPTIHPENYLNVSEAIALVGLANSVVAAMLKEIPDVDTKQPEIPGLAGGLAAIMGKAANETGEAA